MEFLKAVKEGVGNVCAYVFVALIFVIDICFFTQIPKCNGWGSVLLFISCVFILLFVIMLLWVIGLEHLDYKELSEQRRKELTEKLNSKEEEVCTTNSIKY